jgi:hypothetical protein
VGSKTTYNDMILKTIKPTEFWKSLKLHFAHDTFNHWVKNSFIIGKHFSKACLLRSSATELSGLRYLNEPAF